MKKKTPKKVKLGRITYVGISRLFNAGNYENVKYELGAEVPADACPSETFRQMVFVITSLKPLRKPSCYDQYQAAAKKTEAEQSEWEKGHIKEWAEEVSNYLALKQRREEALMELDKMGSKTTYKDAKRNWESNDDVPF